MFSYKFDKPEKRNDDDSASSMLLGVVVDPEFDWSGDRSPKIPYSETDATAEEEDGQALPRQTPAK